MRVWGDPGGSGGSENHIWKIFYRALFEIGTPGIPRGVPRDQIFFEKFSWEKLFGPEGPTLNDLADPALHTRVG